MRTINAFILLCVFSLFCQPTLAWRRVRLADLPPFERAVVVVKYFEGMHRWKNYPYYLKTNIIQRFTEEFIEDGVACVSKVAPSLERAAYLCRLSLDNVLLNGHRLDSERIRLLNIQLPITSR